MKKWFALLMIMVLMISALAACGGGTPPPAPAGAVEALQAALAAVNAADPASILKAHYAARNAYDLENALALVADDAVFTTPNGDYAGKAKIEDLLVTIYSGGNQFTLSDIQVNGNTVTFTVVVDDGSGNPTTLSGETVIQDGVIVTNVTR